MFSILTLEFKSEITSPDDLLNKIRNSAIVPKPICEELTFIWEWREFVKPNLSESRLQNHSFLHSFMIKKEGTVGVLRGRKYPQDTSEWKPNDGIQLLKAGVEFIPIGTAELRVEKLMLEDVFQGLYTRYFPQLFEMEKRKAISSWEKLRSMIENLPKKSLNLPKMRLLELPQQVRDPSPPVLPSFLESLQPSENRVLAGSKHVMEPETSIFQSDIQPNMDVALYTRQKSTRPWLGRVISVLAGGQDFVVRWFKKKSRSTVYQASSNPNGTPFTSTMSADSVMLWNFSDNKTENSFEVSSEWFEKIMKHYHDHDSCYI